MGEIFSKFKNIACKFLNACYSLKEDANRKNYGSTRDTQSMSSLEKFKFMSVKYTGVCLPRIG